MRKPDFIYSNTQKEGPGSGQTQSGFPLVSIIIPCFNEENFIGTILSNILSQDYPREFIEVLIVDGMSSDKTRLIVQSYEKKYSFIHLENNERQFVPFALNLGIKKSKGEVIMIMGSHSTYPPDYVSILVKALFDLDADNVGALCDTRPSTSTLQARAIAKVISYPFGVGNAYFRIGAKKRMKVDTVTFGCYRRSVFDKIGLFDEELLRNQDDEFNSRLIRNGGSIYLIPEVSLVYYSRDKIRSLLQMYYQYGLFKPLVSIKNGRPTTLRQIIPFVFTLFLFGGIPIALLNQVFCGFFLAVISLYFLLDLIFCLKICWSQRSPGLVLYLPWLFFLLHLSYGLGYFVGLFNFVILKKKKSQIISSR